MLVEISCSVLLEFWFLYFEGEAGGLAWLKDDLGYVVVMWTGRRWWLVLLVVVEVVLLISCGRG